MTVAAKRIKRVRRRWWHRLIAVVATLINPALGLVVGIAVETLTNKSSISIDGINPTDAQIAQAKVIMERYVIPILNGITTKITTLQSSMPQTEIIAILNDNLLKIAILQAYVRHSMSSTNVINYMVGATIEALLAKMNMLATDAINRTGLQKNVETKNITIIASNYPKLGMFKLDWNGREVSYIYQKLFYVNHSTTNTAIIPSSDNPTLSTQVQTVTIQNTPNPILNGDQPTIGADTEKSKGVSKFLLGLGLFVGYKILTKKSKRTGLNGNLVCKKRNCKGVNKLTGRTKKGHRYLKGGNVAKAKKGLTKDLKLKKGYRYAKGGRIIKAKKGKGLKAAAPLKINLD